MLRLYWWQLFCEGATTFVTIVETFPTFPLVNVGHEKIRPHEETSTLRGEQGVSGKLHEGCLQGGVVLLTAVNTSL